MTGALEIGDVVEFKSGGTRMTVCHITDKYVDVIWMDGIGHKQEARLPMGILTRVSTATETLQKILKNGQDPLKSLRSPP
jgi:uncharacterized protein YodC (DUF2158 family)